MPIPAQRNIGTNQFKSSNNMNNSSNKLNSVSAINMNNGQTLMNISNQMSQSQAFINNGINNNGVSNNNNNNIQAKSDALTKANLFKSRTLLNDQSKR